MGSRRECPAGPGRVVLRVGVAACIVTAAIVGCGAREAAIHDTALRISSVPYPNADVVVRGEYVGQTPLTLTGLPPGPVAITLYAPGYRNTPKTVLVPEEGESTSVEVHLDPLVGYLSMDSTPPLATVLIDGKDVLGETPFIGREVPIGEHTYEVRKEHYETQSKTWTVQQDYRYRFSHDLILKPGLLAVFSYPGGAMIWINNQLQKDRTPAKFTLAPGSYTIGVYTKGFILGESVVKLGPEEEKAVDLRLKQGEAPPGMVLVPAGDFICGVDVASADERPKRKMFLDAFYIDKYEVTNEQYRAVFLQHRLDKGKENYPVTGVSFKEATAYALAVGKRLPTEFEWEKAARGTDGREYPWGEKFDGGLCNSSETLGADLKEVGRYLAGASSCGCLDMAGNAYEWTSSWYQVYPGNTEIRKEYGLTFRVLRGGSYTTGSFGVRCARRYYDRVDAARNDYGFRCVADIVAPEGGQWGRPEYRE